MPITLLFTLSQMPLIMRHSLEENVGKDGNRRHDGVHDQSRRAAGALQEPPAMSAVSKELRSLDPHCRGFLARSPFVLIGSSDGDGNADVTPKGDRPGFVAVLDDTTIAIPDRPGNNRLDTLENIVPTRPSGCCSSSPAWTRRCASTARRALRRCRPARASAGRGKLPTTVILVAVKAVYMHCAKAFMRSELWQPDSWPDRADAADARPDPEGPAGAWPIRPRRPIAALDELLSEAMW